MGYPQTNMIYIAHRGLTTGPDVNLENRPQQIEMSLRRGYHCEIDVWYINDKWFLGHDFADYQVPYEFLEQPNLWIHAKNLAALYELTDTNLNFFWHENDDFTLTSHKHIWTYPGKLLTANSIMVMPEWQDPTLTNAKESNCYGVCSDYVGLLQ